VVVATLMLGATSAQAQLLFGYENGEPGLPYAGNPASYVTTLTNAVPPVTQGIQALSVRANTNLFGGPGSSSLLDPTIANVISGSPAVLIDMTVPNVPINFGNIDLQFFQAGMRGGAGFDETGFSPTFALSPGQTITLQIPLINTQFGSPQIILDPNVPWSYQIDISFGLPAGGTFPLDFGFDNLRAVPEPASFAGASLLVGSLAMARRRRA
jgi:hypothetical protein